MRLVILESAAVKRVSAVRVKSTAEVDAKLPSVAATNLLTTFPERHVLEMTADVDLITETHDATMENAAAPLATAVFSKLTVAGIDASNPLVNVPMKSMVALL